jgi:hypothetical protein
MCQQSFLYPEEEQPPPPKKHDTSYPGVKDRTPTDNHPMDNRPAHEANTSERSSEHQHCHPENNFSCHITINEDPPLQNPTCSQSVNQPTASTNAIKSYVCTNAKKNRLQFKRK